MRYPIFVRAGFNPVMTKRLSDPTCLQLGCELLVGSLPYYGINATIKKKS